MREPYLQTGFIRLCWQKLFHLMVLNGLFLLCSAGVLTIPALGLELPVQTEWSKANLKVSPCRQCGSTAGGDLVIAAHNYKSHFGRLSSLSEGDEVRFTSQDGAEAVYTVERTAQVSPEEPEALREGGCPLVLYTCTPGGKARVVVYCQRENAA